MNADDQLKTIAKGAGIVFVGIFISKFLGYLYRMIVARAGTEIYGLFNMGLSVYVILATIASFGLYFGVARYVAYYNESNDKGKIKGVILSALRITLVLSLVLGFLLFLTSDWIAIRWFHNEGLSIVLKILAFALPLEIVGSVLLHSLRGFKRVNYEVISKNIVEVVIKLILTAVFLYIGWGLFGIALAYMVGLASSLILAFYFLEKKVFPLVSKIKPVYINKELVSYSWPLLLNSFILFLGLSISTILLGYFKDASAAGIYNVAWPTANLMYFIPSALMTIFLPVLTGVYSRRDKKTFNSLYKTVTKWVFLGNILLLAAFILFSKEILGLLFGKDYVVGSTALLILGSSYFMVFLLLGSENILMIMNKTKLVFMNSAIGCIASVVVNIILIPLYGIVGAAIATSTAAMIKAGFVYVQSYKLTKVHPFKWNYIKIFFAAAVAFLVVKVLTRWIEVTTIYLLIFVGAILGFIYLIFVVITKSFEKDDIMIIRLVRNKLNIEIRWLENLIKRFI